MKNIKKSLFHNKIPVNKKKYLLGLLNKTSKGTKFWESPPAGKLDYTDYYRIIIQAHQFLSIMQNINFNLKGKTLLDVGCGNAMVTNIILNFSNLKNVIGSDPFWDGEHTTSWQKLDSVRLLKNLRNIITKRHDNKLSFNKYKKFIFKEDYSVIPGDINVKLQNSKIVKKFRYGAHDINKLNKKFDILYCKAIEHISDWENLAKSFNKCTKRGGLVFIKHRSFFSYLGPHRYGSTYSPWGHVFLSDKEYTKYVKKYAPERQKKYLDFIFKELNYPRETVEDLIKHFLSNGFYLHSTINESARYQKKVTRFIKDVPNFWKSINKVYPNLSHQELFSGIYNIVFKKLD